LKAGGVRRKKSKSYEQKGRTEFRYSGRRLDFIKSSRGYETIRTFTFID